MSGLTEDERAERRIAWFLGGSCLVTLAWIIAIFTLVAWVIIRITLRFT